MLSLPTFLRRERIHLLKKAPLKEEGRYVLYFMEASQRATFNHALETALFGANELKKPLLVYFGLTDRYRYSNLRYYTFMLEGIMKVKEKLKERGIRLVILKEDPPEGAIKLAQEASLLVLDRGYLRHQRVWRKKVFEAVDIPVIEVEGEVIVPVETASNKAEPYARTLRPKLLKYLFNFLEEVPTVEPKVSSLDLEVPQAWEEATLANYLEKLQIDKSVPPVSYFQGGEDEAQRRLQIFLQERLPYYASMRSDPGYQATSELSPYLRFGQISPVQILREVFQIASYEDNNVQTFVNELVVWRELARNYAWFNPLYNQYEGLPAWARETLEKHLTDRRKNLYDLADLENASTLDPYWNAAQRELLTKGTIHNYIRMYWCKKLLEWTPHPKIAFDYACYLNDKYALDGRDPNGYAGISWCFGAFDRPFPERAIYGRIRKMTPHSLLSKKHFPNYLKKYS